MLVSKLRLQKALESRHLDESFEYEATEIQKIRDVQRQTTEYYSSCSICSKPPSDAGLFLAANCPRTVNDLSAEENRYCRIAIEAMAQGIGAESRVDWSGLDWQS